MLTVAAPLDISAPRYRRPAVVGHSDALKEVRTRLEQVAPTSATVLLLGETGTGKTRLAQEIHDQSRRAHKTFVYVDCTALPPTLLESELFGRERGAFTDARTSQIGRFELAHGGTLFLDEIGDLPLEMQAKLLRVIQEGQFERLGSPRTISVDVRIIAATNRSLADEVQRGGFRADLFYRLNVFPIEMPPLRARRSDILPLVRHFVGTMAERHEKAIENIPPDVLRELQAYDWPGNIRELENAIERAVIAATDTTLRLREPLSSTEIRFNPEPPPQASRSLADVERHHILATLNAKGWRIEGHSGAAVTLGLKPSTLRSRMQRLQIARPS